MKCVYVLTEQPAGHLQKPHELRNIYIIKFKESKFETFRRLSTNTGIKEQNIKNEILI